MATAIEMPALAPVERAVEGGSGGGWDGVSRAERLRLVEVSVIVVGDWDCVISILSAEGMGAAKPSIARWHIMNWRDNRLECSDGGNIITGSRVEMKYRAR
jgi:hypothetical protein